jgi:hypothetical protein
MKYLISILFSIQLAYAVEEGRMTLEPRFLAPDSKTLISKVNLDFSDGTIKRKAATRNKFYGLKHIKYVSIYKAAESDKDYMVDFYFHGAEKEFLIKISSVDLRKYFQKKIDIKNSENQCVKLIQSHFEEYNRKSKVFYLSKKNDLLTSNDPLNEITENAIANAFFKKNPSPVFVLTNNCRGVGNFEFEWPGLIKGHFFIPPSFIDKIMGEYDVVKIKNETSPIDHNTSHTEVRTTKFFADQINLSSWNGVKNKLVQWYSSFKDPVYQWYDLGDFSKVSSQCNIENVTHELLKTEQSIQAKKLVVTQVRGKINFEEFAAETRMKSGSVYMQESLAYTKTFCDDIKNTSPPPNFLVPEGDGNLTTTEYWKTNKCAIIPHFFANYEDILNYPVYLSKFEIDGVYVGRARNEDDPVITEYDKSLQKDESKRVKYSFNEFISNYNLALVENNNNFLTVKLENKNHNIVIGNIPLDSLINEEKKPKYFSSFFDVDLFDSNVAGISGLFGINPQPLVDNYSNAFSPDTIGNEPVKFALMYDDKGEVLNHHLPSLGIEQWYMRKRGCDLIVDLISHERILPVARLQIKYFCENK